MEAQMTQDEISEACAIVRSHGWEPGSNTPAWIWAEVFGRIISERSPPHLAQGIVTRSAETEGLREAEGRVEPGPATPDAPRS
jgi:hypothetical protein